MPKVELRPRTPHGFRGFAFVGGATYHAGGVGRLSGRGLPPAMVRMPPRIAPIPKEADAFYLSPEWRKLVDAIKRERGCKCEKCGAHPPVRILGDHIIELKDGGAPFDKRNIMLLCLPCHNKKTAEAKRGRGA
jgi:5-methylcytosine-specific restriction enzyme A